MAEVVLVDEDMNILIVDDFSTMRHMIGNMLREIGFSNISEAESGEEALPILRLDKFDFIVTDWNMPGMCGFTFMNKLKGDESLCRIPVLMVTAEDDAEQINRATDAGVDGYVVKPFNATILRDRIENIVVSVRL
ncbi:MAG: two-component system chemotaxis response regulator CheY [Planctomycetota bacterium]